MIDGDSAAPEQPLGTGGRDASESLPPAPDSPEVSSVARLVGRGLRWSVLNTLISRLGSFVSGIILARLLVPEDYGVFAVALVVLNAVLSMNELGVSLAVVRWPDDPEEIAPTVTSMSLISSAVLYLACFVSAPTIASALHAPAATWLIRALTVCVLIDAIAAVPAALINRRIQQGRRLVMDVVGFVSGTSVTLSLALLGFGPWSMVFGQLCISLVTMVGSIILAGWHGIGFDRSVARRLLSFGLPLAGASLLVFFSLNIDYIIVGRVMDPWALGLYTLAFNLCNWPISLISVTVRRVALAGFSRFNQEAERGARVFAEAWGLLLVVALPMCIPLGLLAAPLITIVYGERWVAAAEALQFLAILAVARVLLELGYDYLVAVGRTKPTVWLQVLWTGALLPALYLGARYFGLMGVAVGHAAVAGLLIVPAYLTVLGAVGVRSLSILRASGRPGLSGLAMAAVILLLRQMLPNPWLQVISAGTVGLVVYAIGVLPLLRRALSLSRGAVIGT